MVAGISFSGLASGLDTTAIIQQLVALERLPITRLEQRIQTAQKRLSLFQNLNTSLMTLLDRATGFKDADSLDLRTAVSSHPDVVAATAGPGSVLGSFNIEVIQLAQPQAVSSVRSWTAGTDTVGATGDFLLNGVTVHVDATDSVALVVAKINEADAGVSTTLVQVAPGDYRISLVSATAGSQGIEFTDSGGVLEALGILSGGVPNETQAGTDAIVKVNGLQITRNSNTISDAIEGVTLSLLAARPGQPVTVTLDRDEGSIKTQIRDFVTSFNAVREFLNQNAKYDPASKTAGALLGDYAAYQVESRLSRIANHMVDLGESGAYSLSRIGITRDRQGMLQIDEAKLDAALADHFDEVRALFTTAELGLGAEAERVLDILTDPVAGTIKFRTDAIRASIDDMNDSIDRMEDRVARVEERLLRQFTALETTLARFQQVGTFLEQQLATLGGLWNTNQS